MPVRLRLSMHGPRHSKIFHLVAVDLRKRRDAKPIELLGVYNPRMPHGSNEKKMEWAVDRIKYWLDAGGASPSKSVVRLLERGGIIPPDSKYHVKSSLSPTSSYSTVQNPNTPETSGKEAAGQGKDELQSLFSRMHVFSEQSESLRAQLPSILQSSLPPAANTEDVAATQHPSA